MTNMISRGVDGERHKDGPCWHGIHATIVHCRVARLDFEQFSLAEGFEEGCICMSLTPMIVIYCYLKIQLHHTVSICPSL